MTISCAYATPSAMDAMMHIYILSIYHISRYAHSIPSIEFYTLEGLLQGLPISRRVDFDYGSSSKSPDEAHLAPNIRVRDPGHATWRRASLCPNVLCILIREPDKNQFFHFHVFSKKKITQVSPYGIEIFSQKKCEKKSHIELFLTNNIFNTFATIYAH